MSRNRIRVGLVGAGWGERVHIPTFKALPEAELLAVCTAHPETAEAVARRNGIGKAYADYEKLAADPDIDLVSVAVRVEMHHPIVLAALRAGKHVLCEWPLALNSGQAREMLSLAASKGLRHAVGAQARGSPALLHMKALLDQGFIGRVLAFHMTSFLPTYIRPLPAQRRWTATRAGGAGALTVQGGHSTDILLWTLGDIASLCGDASAQLAHWTFWDTKETIEVTAPDHAAFLARMRNGAAGAAHFNRAAWHGSGFRFEVYGTEGALTAVSRAMHQASPVKLYGARRDEDLREIEIPARLVEAPDIPSDAVHYNFAQFARRFLRSLQEGRPFQPDFSDGLRLHRVLEAVEESSRRRAWLTLE
ncbi:MAG: Gfo/Idh/MocA family oxidoreductase [Chloroflexi bacterium]|nr:Gfo/Idh/MocA family oxidoreductase [Chloroflexota bacterium]